MSNNRGYIYVLANSAMPDLVKVGKTTRTPAERATELSKVTGVPTPFIVVYEQLVEDCTAAEEFVHTMLQQKGYRESDNREFFRAPVSEVIGLIIKMPTHFSNNASVDLVDNKGNFRELLRSRRQENWKPWLESWKTAKKYEYGSDDCIQDYNEAMELYKQAIKLGCLSAYEKVGDFHLYGLGVIQSKTKALEWYKEGTKKGNYYCYARMAEVFASNNENDNFHKCYKLLFKHRNEQQNSDIEKFSSGLRFYCYYYVQLCFWWNIVPSDELINEIKIHKAYIVGTLEALIEGKTPSQQTFLDETALKWVKHNLEPFDRLDNSNLPVKSDNNFPVHQLSLTFFERLSSVFKRS